MGGYLSTNKNDQSMQQKIEELESKIADIDKNNDQVISVQEFREWQMEKEINYVNKITYLEQQVETLKSLNEELQNRIKNKVSNDASNVHKQNIATKVSTQEIKKYVEEMLKNKDVNIKMLPDFVERKIYQNMFEMILGMVDHILETTKIDFMGHEILFDVREKQN